MRWSSAHSVSGTVFGAEVHCTAVDGLQGFRAWCFSHGLHCFTFSTSLFWWCRCCSCVTLTYIGFNDDFLWYIVFELFTSLFLFLPSCTRTKIVRSPLLLFLLLFMRVKWSSVCSKLSTERAVGGGSPMQLFTNRGRSFALRGFHNKLAPCTSSVAFGESSAEPPLSKQGYES